MSETLLREVERIRPVLEEQAERAEAERRLTDAAYDAMLDAGLFRIVAPRAFGGLELHPVEAYRVWEAVARIDSAAAWNLQQSASVSGFAIPWLAKEGGEEVYAKGPDTIFAGGFFPPAPSVPVEGGWRVTARAAFASGCHRAQWFVVPIVEVDDESSQFDPHTEDPPAILALIPRDEVDLVDTWHTVGMRGTFSADVVVDDVFVPDRRIARIGPEREPAPAFSGPLYRIPWPGIHGETTVSLGIAGAAIDELVALAARKTPRYSRIPLRDREMAQHHAARASALLEASRAFLHTAISDACAEVERDGTLAEATKRRCQLAACFGAEACAEAVDLVHEAAGTAAIRIGQRIERHHRDIHVLTQHADKSYARYEDVGKMLFGLSPSFFVLEL